MHVYIEQGGINLNIDHRNRVAASEQAGIIGPFHSSSKHTAQNPAAIDKERDILPRTFIAGRLAHIAADHRVPRVIGSALTSDRHHLLRNLEAIDLDQHTGELSIAGGSEDLAPIAGNAEANLRIGQRVLFEQVATMADLCIAALQKF